MLQNQTKTARGIASCLQAAVPLPAPPEPVFLVNGCSNSLKPEHESGADAKIALHLAIRVGHFAELVQEVVHFPASDTDVVGQSPINTAAHCHRELSLSAACCQEPVVDVCNFHEHFSKRCERL